MKRGAHNILQGSDSSSTCRTNSFVCLQGCPHQLAPSCYGTGILALDKGFEVYLDISLLKKKPSNNLSVDPKSHDVKKQKNVGEKFEVKKKGIFRGNILLSRTS